MASSMAVALHWTRKPMDTFMCGVNKCGEVLRVIEGKPHVDLYQVVILSLCTRESSCSSFPQMGVSINCTQTEKVALKVRSAEWKRMMTFRTAVCIQEMLRSSLGDKFFAIQPLFTTRSYVISILRTSLRCQREKLTDYRRWLLSTSALHTVPTYIFFLLSIQNPARPWGTPSLLFNCHCGLFPRDVKLITNHHLEPK
jgi:hypothetical protein